MGKPSSLCSAAVLLEAELQGVCLQFLSPYHYNTQLCARYNVTNLLDSFSVRPLTLATVSLAKVSMSLAKVSAYAKSQPVATISSLICLTYQIISLS